LLWRQPPLTAYEADAGENHAEGNIKRVPEGHYVQWVNACMAGYGKGETSSPFDFAGLFTESILISNLASAAL